MRSCLSLAGVWTMVAIHFHRFCSSAVWMRVLWWRRLVFGAMEGPLVFCRRPNLPTPRNRGTSEGARRKKKKKKPRARRKKKSHSHVPCAHWEAYGRGSLPLHNLVSDSANPHYVSDPLPQSFVGSS